MAFGHGMQDAAKTIGIVVLALYIGGSRTTARTSRSGSTSSTAGGALARHLRGRLADHPYPGPQGHPPRPAPGVRGRDRRQLGAVRQRARLGAPISTTHTITSAIMGVGATKRLSAVRWGVAGNIVVAWILTFPAAALVAVGSYLLISLFG